MKKIHNINENVELVLFERYFSTSAILYVDNKVLRLCKVDGTNGGFFVSYGYNENYLVVFSRGTIGNSIPLTVEAVYDLVNNRVVKVTEKNSKIFEYMCVCKKSIEPDVILEFLNDNKLELVEPCEVEDFIRYVTAENSDISKEEIKAYVLKEYPYFKDYMNFETTFTVKQYKSVIKNFKETIWLHIMPNALKAEELS